MTTTLDAAAVEAHVDAVVRDGYTIVEDAIEPELVDELAASLAQLEEGLGTVPADDDFEVRVVAVVGQHRARRDGPADPRGRSAHPDPQAAPARGVQQLLNGDGEHRKIWDLS